MAAIEIDDARWPLLVVRFTGTSTDAEFDGYLARLGSFVARRQDFALILDASRAGATPPLHRKKQAEFMAREEVRLRKHSAGTAFVITSALVRGALTAIFWLQPMPSEHTIASTYEEAEQWAVQQLRRRGVEVPPRG